MRVLIGANMSKLAARALLSKMILCSEGTEEKSPRLPLIEIARATGSIDCQLRKETVRVTDFKVFDTSKLKRMAR